MGVRATDDEPIQALYLRRLEGIHEAFASDRDGLRASKSRSELLDEILQRLWSLEGAAGPALAKSVTLMAVGGYGRAQLFPHSDIDILFCTEKAPDAETKEAIRRVSQALWDCGMRAAPITRTIGECERFSPDNAEFGLSLLDRRFVAGNVALAARLNERIQSKMLSRDVKTIRTEIVTLTRERHAKYGGTLFHLEPNVKDCPGGLRDINVCTWLRMLSAQQEADDDHEFQAAIAFLASLRWFLHVRHQRDDNTLDWQAQDAAAETHIGAARSGGAPGHASAWMRAYFRHARLVDRRLHRAFEANGFRLSPRPEARRAKLAEASAFTLRDGRISFDATSAVDAASDPDVVLGVFAAVARTGADLSVESEERITAALPQLAAHLDDWPALWPRLSAVLDAPYAGLALRSMHAIGLLELILPEFHGIDALVIRDAYHRYTVDEHTFVLIDELHDLERTPAADAPEWRVKFGALIRELHHRGALFLAALLHDTGKGRLSSNHAQESARIAQSAIERLDIDPYDAALALALIENHLEMSSALRRDIFDVDTVKAFAAKVQTHDLLRMLTVFTYADIQAVHPDALTPWKAENLWRLSMSAANQMDRSVDEERVHTRGQDERVTRVLELVGSRKADAELFLEGFPERYLQTRPKEAIADHFDLTTGFAREPFQIAFQYGAEMSEITLVTHDKPRLFANVAGALAAWGMNVVTAEAFANASGVVVDTFRFTDLYNTLELNESERERFVSSMRDMIAGKVSIDAMLKGRRGRRKRGPRLRVETRVSFDETASPHSTLLQVIAQDTTGLLRALSQTLSDQGYNVEVALIDTEGDTAIDVFYLTRGGKQVDEEQQRELSLALRAAIESNAA